jgi:hypothetical protein
MADRPPGRETVAIAATLSLPRGRDPLYREVYSNVSTTQMGPFDVTLLLQKQSEIAPGQMGIIDHVSVTFSPQHFKALVRSLNETLKGYEESFGELKIPDVDIAPQRTSKEIVDLVRAGREAVAVAKEHASHANPPGASATEPQRHEKRSHDASPKKASEP